jgi:hypothetical protein
MNAQQVRRGLVGAVASGALVAGLSGGVAAASSPAPSAPGTSATATTVKPGFLRAQKLLEARLTDRANELARLSADVKGATTLSTSDAATLEARLATETTNITTLQSQVSAATTAAELKTASTSMYVDNRVYAVMVPQVLEVIEADATSAQVTTMQGNEATLEASVTSLVGQPGYKNAASHYDAYVANVTHASVAADGVDASVIAQMPANFPGDTHVFVTASHRLLAAQIDLARASYDASIIGLASGGYTGS